LGNVLIGRGSYKEAERVHREAYALRRAAIGETHAETANSLLRLAVALQGQGRLVEAESLGTLAFTIKRAALGAGHPDIAEDSATLEVIRRARAGSERSK
jgi:hypothetical protein